jgi:hypothetical protein
MLEDPERNKSVVVPRLLSLEDYCKLFEEVASRSLLRKRADNTDVEIEKLKKEIAALKVSDINL